MVLGYLTDRFVLKIECMFVPKYSISVVSKQSGDTFSYSIRNMNKKDYKYLFKSLKC